MCTGRPTATLYEPDDDAPKRPRRTTTKIVAFLLRARDAWGDAHPHHRPSIPHLLFELAHRGPHVT